MSHVSKKCILTVNYNNIQVRQWTFAKKNISNIHCVEKPSTHRKPFGFLILTCSPLTTLKQESKWSCWLSASLDWFHFTFKQIKRRCTLVRQKFYLCGNWCLQRLTLYTLAGICPYKNHNSCVGRAHAHVSLHMQLRVEQDGWMLECCLSLKFCCV